MIAYKVVRKSFDSATCQTKYLSSQTSKWDKERQEVEYKINEWVKAPEGTRLFCFETLKEAKDFSEHLSDFVFKCKIKGHVKYYPSGNLYEIQKYWNQVNDFLKRKKKLPIDIGVSLSKHYPSLLAKEVMLLEKV